MHEESHSAARVDEQRREVVAEIVATEISDPRVDARHGHRRQGQLRPQRAPSVFVSASPERYDEVLEGLESAKGRIRSLLGHRLGWRVTPELRFHIDESVDAGVRIAEALTQRPAHARRRRGRRAERRPKTTRSREARCSPPCTTRLVALRRAPSVVVCAHVRPTATRSAPCSALTLALRELGRPCDPDARRRPRRAERPTAGFPASGSTSLPRDLEAPAVFVALDTPEPRSARRRARARRERRDARRHRPPSRRQRVRRTSTCSTRARRPPAQLVWQLRRARSRSHPRAEIALCCYAALLTDTGRFSYQNTTPDALRDAADMVEAGVDPSEVARLVYQTPHLGLARPRGPRDVAPHLRQRRPRRLRVGRRRRLRRDSALAPRRPSTCPRRSASSTASKSALLLRQTRHRGARQPARQDQLRRRRRRSRTSAVADTRRGGLHRFERDGRPVARADLCRCFPEERARERPPRRDRPLRHPARRQARRA